MTHNSLITLALWKIPVLVAAFFCCSHSLSAQRPSPSVGIGFQAGSPTGLSLQFYRETGMYTDILFAWDLDDFFFVNVHGLWDQHLDAERRLHVFYGPGLFLGVRDRKGRELPNDNNPVFGVSGDLGLNLVFGRVELFGQVTPRLALTPGTDLNVGGGAGLRFFF